MAISLLKSLENMPKLEGQDGSFEEDISSKLKFNSSTDKHYNRSCL